jgi:hypothetical protein
MDKNDLSELLACLSKDKTHFHYFHDYYAVQLLTIAAERYQTLSSLKQSRFGKLLNNATVTQLISGCQNDRLDLEQFKYFWREPSTTYLLTTGIWRNRRVDVIQTSRPRYSLALHLNFNHQHNKIMQKSEVFDYIDYMRFQWLPFDFKKTLACARLDIDLDKGEALIEEIRSDWAKVTIRLHKTLMKYIAIEQRHHGHIDIKATRMLRYHKFVDPILKEWSQTVLSATIDFIYHELGLKQIWYHTWEVGNCLKVVDAHHHCPKSLYTRLPRQFCFERVEHLPDILNNRHTIKCLYRAKMEPVFYQLKL